MIDAVRTAAFARATDSSSIQMPHSTLQSPLIAAKDATMLSALENMKGMLANHAVKNAHPSS